MTDRTAVPDGPRLQLLYHFCRLQLPAINLSVEACRRHLERTFSLSQARNAAVSWDVFFENLYPLDWFVACGCVDGNDRAWEQLFAARAGRSDCLLMDALRARATRLYPRDEERQESAVTEFWSHLYVPESEGSVPVLARYDGQRPLVPWLIRVFQNWHISQLRRVAGVQALPEDDVAGATPFAENGRWRELFCEATHDWLASLSDRDVLFLGLRLRYRMSQREVAGLLEVHEGTISRRTDSLREQCLAYLAQRLTAEGWAGDDLFDFVRTEMQHLLLDDPRLSVDHLAQLLTRLGKKRRVGPRMNPTWPSKNGVRSGKQSSTFNPSAFIREISGQKSYFRVTPSRLSAGSADIVLLAFGSAEFLAGRVVRGFYVGWGATVTNDNGPKHLTADYADERG